MSQTSYELDSFTGVNRATHTLHISQRIPLHILSYSLSPSKYTYLLE